MSRCSEAVEGVHEDCCLHDCERAEDTGQLLQVCCWCGDLYLGRQEENVGHGEYLPDYAKRAAEPPKEGG